MGDVRGATAPEQLDVEAARRLQRSLGRIARRVRSRTSGGLTPSQLTCLAAIVRDGPVRASDIAAREGVNPTALSRVLGHLGEAGYVTRTSDPTDGRVALLVVTRKGRAVLERVRAERTALLLDRTAGLDPADRAALAAALPALERLAESLDSDVATTRGSRRP